MPHSEDVYEGDAQAFNAFGYLINANCGVLGEFGLSHEICSV